MIKGNHPFDHSWRDFSEKKAYHAKQLGGVHHAGSSKGQQLSAGMSPCWEDLSKEGMEAWFNREFTSSGKPVATTGPRPGQPVGRSGWGDPLSGIALGIRHIPGDGERLRPDWGISPLEGLGWGKMEPSLTEVFLGQWLMALGGWNGVLRHGQGGGGPGGAGWDRQG